MTPLRSGLSRLRQSIVIRIRSRVAERGLPRVTPGQLTKESIRRLVPGERPTILEIGCNDGDNTLWFLDLFEQPRIHCFEPDPRAIARFRANVGDRDGVQLFELAISDRDGSTTLHQSGGRSGSELDADMPEGWDLSGSIRPPKQHLEIYPWVTFDDRIEVATSTLDSWRRAHGIERVDFIWMDVQGAEMDVFAGGRETLERTELLYTEYSNEQLYEGQSTLRQILDHLTRFQVVTRFPGDVLLRQTRSVRGPG